MIRREDLRELAQFRSEEGSALSFYFQPGTPQNKSHREEVILAKDLVREAMRELERNGNGKIAREDLDRILQVAEGMHGNQTQAKLVFACASAGFWREFDIPARLPGTRELLVETHRAGRSSRWLALVIPGLIAWPVAI